MVRTGARDGSKVRHILLRTAAIDTENSAPAVAPRTSPDAARAALNVHATHSEYSQYLVHTMGTIAPHARSVIESRLAHPGSVEYVPHHTFLVLASPDEVSALSHEPSVLWIGSYKPEHKFLPSLVSSSGARSASCARDEPHTALRVHFHKSVVESIHPLTALSAQLVDSIVASSDLERDDVVVTRASSSDLYVVFPCGHIGAVAPAIASHSLVNWLEPRATNVVKNGNGAGLLQTFNPTSTPFYSATPALDGSGQIVGVADTGLDMSSCFFSDPGKSVPYNTIDQTHRKVVQYQTRTTTNQDSFEDYSLGHGTHVAGSVAGYAGAAQTASLPYRGSAYNAKIAFYDFGVGEGSLLSTDAQDDIFPPGYQAGARIHSNSWGAVENPGYYSLEARGVDEYAHDKMDFLPMFAASNDGSEGLISVRAPATGKNTLAVGASNNDYRSAEEAESMNFFTLTIGTSVYTGRRGTIGARATGASTTAPIAYFSSISCTSYSGASGAIAVLRAASSSATTCTRAGQAKAAQDSGALAVILLTSSRVSGSESGVTIPVGSISTSDQSALIAADGSSATFADADKPNLSADTSYSKNNLACFSSRGPTLDGRYKPDLTAPGNPVISAYSNGESDVALCGLAGVAPLQGTSMATPLAAGAAAQVRQYLVDGYHPTGAAVSGNAVPTPTAALVKAFLLQSTVSHTGFVQIDCSDTATRSFSSMSLDEKRYYEGYGHIQLDKVLHQASPSAGSISTLFEDNKTGLSTGAHSTKCYSVLNGQDFRATLVWTDPAASPASQIALVNDLDLVVNYDTAGSSTVTHLGNQRIDTKNANVPIVDSTNNVEQITIASGDLPANGAGGISTLAVTVSAFNVPSGPQQYALVMTGDSVTELAASACAFACPASCSNQGTCNAGRCECNAGFAGADCSIAVTTLTIGSSSPVSGSLSADGWIYYMFQPDTSKNLDVRFKVTANQGVPVFFGQAGEYPTPASASDVLEWCTNCDQTTVQGSSSRTFNFWIRQANLASSGMHYVAVYGFPYNRQAYASSSTSFQFETSYERFFEDESPALSLSPSLILTLLVSLLSLFVVMF